jgi:hypothetical protein
LWLFLGLPAKSVQTAMQDLSGAFFSQNRKTKVILGLRTFFLDMSIGSMAQIARRGPKISARAEKLGMNIGPGQAQGDV